MALFMGFTVKRMCEKWVYEWLQQMMIGWTACIHRPGRPWKIFNLEPFQTFAMLSCDANDPRFDSCARKKVVRPLGAVRLSGCGIEVILVGRVWRTLGAFREYPWTSQFLLNYLKIIRSYHFLMISAMKSWSQFNDAQALSRCIHGFVWKLGSRKSQFQWGKLW